jgi:hypothetical protein
VLTVVPILVRVLAPGVPWLRTTSCGASFACSGVPTLVSNCRAVSRASLLRLARWWSWYLPCWVLGYLGAVAPAAGALRVDFLRLGVWTSWLLLLLGC